jgi:hypothetical protein
MVIRLGGLLPERELEEKIEWAVQSGTIHHWDAAVTSSLSLPQMPEAMANWFRAQLSDRLLYARERADVLKLEAIAARSPANIGASWIVSRSAAIRGLFQMSERVESALSVFLPGEPLTPEQTRKFRLAFGGYLQTCFLFIPFILVIEGIAFWQFSRMVAGALIGLGVFALVRLLQHILRFIFKSVGAPLGPQLIIRGLSQARMKVVKNLRIVAKFAGLTFAVGIGAGGVCHFFGRQAGYQGNAHIFYLIGPLVLVFLFSAGESIKTRLDRRISGKRLRLERALGESGVPLAFRALSLDEIRYWLRYSVAEVLPTSADARSFLRCIQTGSDGELQADGATHLGQEGALNYPNSQRVTGLVISRCLELEAEAKRGSD